MCFKIYSSSPLSVYNDLNEDLKKINTIQKTEKGTKKSLAIPPKIEAKVESVWNKL